MSKSVDDEEKIVKENRDIFYNNWLKPENIVHQKQIHSDKVTYVTKGGMVKAMH